MPKIRLFGTFLLSFLHFPKYFLYFSQSKTMNRMGGGLHQKERFFADLPCTLLSTYTYPKIFNTPQNTPKTLPKRPIQHSLHPHHNTPKIPQKSLSHPTQHPHNTHHNTPITPHNTPHYPLQRILMTLFTLMSPYPITYATT